MHGTENATLLKPEMCAVMQEAASGLRAFNKIDSEVSSVLPEHATRKLMQPAGGGGPMDGGPGGAMAPVATTAMAPAATATDAPAGITDTTCSLSGVEYCTSYSIEDTTYGTMMTVTVTDTTRDIESNAVPDFETGYDDTITEDEISYSYPLVPVWTGAQTVTRAPGISIHGIPLDPAGQDIDCDGTALSLEVCPRVV